MAGDDARDAAGDIHGLRVGGGSSRKWVKVGNFFSTLQPIIYNTSCKLIEKNSPLLRRDTEIPLI